MQIIQPKTNHQFIKNRKIFLSISAVVIGLFLLLPLVIEPNWGTSFRGGSSIIVRFEKDTSSEEVRDAFKSLGFPDASVQSYGENNRFMIKTGQVSTLDCAAIENAEKKIPELLGERIASVSFPKCADIRDAFPISFTLNEPQTPQQSLPSKHAASDPLYAQADIPAVAAPAAAAPAVAAPAAAAPAIAAPAAAAPAVAAPAAAAPAVAAPAVAAPAVAAPAVAAPAAAPAVAAPAVAAPAAPAVAESTKPNESATKIVEDESLRDPVSGISVAELSRAFASIGFDASLTFETRSNRRGFVIRPRQMQSKISKGLDKIFNEGITAREDYRFDPEIGVAEIVSVGADVGEKFRNDGIVSILFALGLILLYVGIRFDIRYAPGAVVALAHDVIFTFGILIFVNMEITLETVAALLAIVGYSLNDTIVTFDRIRENISSGSDEPLPALINRSINECLSRTILTSVTTFVAIISLALLGTGIVADFAWTLIIGVLIGTYSSIFIASPIMLAMHNLLESRKKGGPTQRPLPDFKVETPAS